MRPTIMGVIIVRHGKPKGVLLLDTGMPGFIDPPSGVSHTEQQLDIVARVAAHSDCVVTPTEFTLLTGMSLGLL